MAVVVIHLIFDVLFCINTSENHYVLWEHYTLKCFKDMLRRQQKCAIVHVDTSEVRAVDENDFRVLLGRSSLFEKADYTGLRGILSASGPAVMRYRKGDMIFWEQTPVTAFGIFLSGSGIAYRSTSSGNNIIMAHLEAGSVFGDILAGSENKKSPVSIRANVPSEVLFIDFDAYLSACMRGGDTGEILIRNYIKAVSQRYFELQDRVSCIIMPTLRDKIMDLLKKHSRVPGEPFDIPFDREAMAGYLNADRSALSRELSRMKSEGIIDYYRSTFRLVKDDRD